MQKIAKAIVDFQSKLKPITKDSDNPFYKSKYADLSSILQSVTPILSSCGLSIIQPMRVDQGITLLKTIVLHESGELVESEMILPVISDAQKFGSLITYYKRYQLQALLGISTSDEDDDANMVSSPIVQQSAIKQTPKTQSSNKPASPAQINALKKMGIEFRPEITVNEASELIKKGNEKW
jgi:hypothetical protein